MMSNVTLGAIPNVYMPATSPLSGIGPTGGADSAEGGNFSSILSDAVHGVDQMHDAAASQVSNLLSGGGGDLNQVMVAVEKADVSFQLMMQVRNKIVNAYQDIEKMQF
jgi:flagellar hook-basal body complex protein FliE